MAGKTDRFEQWKKNLKATYGDKEVFTKSWLEKEWARVSRVKKLKVPSVQFSDGAISGVIAKKDSIEKIREDLGDCVRCKLSTTRTNIVFGEGNIKSKIIFVGEGPGKTEDETGRPFIGRGGQLLEKIIEAMGYKREDVYIANVVKCRPPENRRPEKDEVATCEPFLHRQIDVIKPKVIVALGATALECLMPENKTAITELRGQFMDFRGTKLVVTYHPAFLLRNPPAKKDVWEDMKKVMKFLEK